MAIEVCPASPERFADIAAVLGGGACWCQYWRMTSSEYGRGTAAELPPVAEARRARLGQRVKDSPAPGVVAYADGEPVGWCGLGPRAEFARLQRSRVIPRVDDVAVWSIVCFLVRVGHRRSGVAAALLAGAVDYARTEGAPALEAYPVDAEGGRIDTAFAYVGTTSMFEAAGFHRVAETRSTSAGRNRWVMRLDLP